MSTDLDWQQRMPQQLIAIHIHTDPYLVPNPVLPGLVNLDQLIIDVWELHLEGDIYSDGELWVDMVDLADWVHSQP